jgi:hypothetical protein
VDADAVHDHLDRAIAAGDTEIDDAIGLGGKRRLDVEPADREVQAAARAR